MRLNENKLKMAVEFYKEKNGEPVNTKEIAKAININPHSKSPENYSKMVADQYPELNVNFIGGGDPKKAPDKSVVTDEPANDPELDKMLGEETPKAGGLEGESDDECCVNPEAHPKKKVAPEVIVDHKVEENVATPPPKPKDNSSEVEYCYINDKGLKVILELKSFKNNRMVFVHKQDEVVEVDIQGHVSKVNLTQLENEGKAAEADFFRKLMNNG